MKNRLTILLCFLVTLLGCSSSKNLGSSLVESNCSDSGNCQFAAKMFEDQFERTNALINSDSETDELNFWWRKIINDQGEIISGQPIHNASVRILSQPEVGPGSDGGSALYFLGRDNRSDSSLYLVSQTFDLRIAERVELSFKYIPIDMEPGEYLKLEVCRSAREACGVGESLSVDGLNSSSWETLFEADDHLGQGFNGKNHTARDWLSARVALEVDSEELTQFTFRFHVRVNGGFIDNDPSKAMSGGVGLDEVSAFAFRTLGKSEPPSIELPTTIDPFNPKENFDPNDPRLF